MLMSVLLFSEQRQTVAVLLARFNKRFLVFSSILYVFHFAESYFQMTLLCRNMVWTCPGQGPSRLTSCWTGRASDCTPRCSKQPEGDFLRENTLTSAVQTCHLQSIRPAGAFWREIASRLPSLRSTKRLLTAISEQALPFCRCNPVFKSSWDLLCSQHPWIPLISCTKIKTHLSDWFDGSFINLLIYSIHSWEVI